MYAADKPHLCRSLDEGKWHWHALYGDFLPSFWGEGPHAFPGASLASCWNCGIWMEETFPPSWNPERVQESLAYDRARCYQALGMHPEALRTCREIVSRHPDGTYTSVCLETILGILFQDGNHAALIGLYHDLNEELLNQVSPEGLYLVSQSLYEQNQDHAAMALLQKIPANSGTHPYALYTKAQIAFRNGEEDQALAFILALLESPRETIPNMLYEKALLTRARISFQKGRYEEAAEHFRGLSRSRFFLPEALMGMGWCYQALGESSRAVSFFQTVEDASLADTSTWARANLEIALLYAKVGAHGESLRIVRNIQNHLGQFIELNKRYSKDRGWLGGLARNLLSGYRQDPGIQIPKQAKFRTGDLKGEMEFLLERRSYTSSRMKRLLAIREALAVVQQSIDRVPDAPHVTEKKNLGSPFQYPPMEASLPLLEPRLTALLNASFALMDTEYRTDQTERHLGLYRQDEEGARHKERLAFFRSLFQKMLLPEHEGKDAYTVLHQMQSTVRNLPFSIEVRRKILTKILYTKKSFRENDLTLHRWSAGMEEAAKTTHQPPRLVMLRAWMTYVRTLVEFRTWEDRSPGVYMKESQPLNREQDLSSLYESTQLMILDRLDKAEKRLRRLLEQEIEQIHDQMLETLEAVFAESQLYHAEALLHKQEALLEAFKSSPADKN